MIRKVVQTVWFKQTPKGIDYTCGWLSPAFHIMSWALSSRQLLRFFDKLELISDNIGAELATEKLHLPYTLISTDLETIKQNSYLWVSNKLYTYSIQDEPFIHLDTDAYFFNRLDSRLLTAPLVAQNFEYDHDNYIHAYQDIMAHCSYIPDFINKDSLGRLTAVNAGVIGGNNVAFFKEFTSFVTEFLQRNEDGLTKCHYAHLNVFVEQFLFKKYADFKNMPIEYVSPIEFGPPCDYKMSEFIQLPTNCNYIHITNYKQNPTVCEQMAQRLWIESPELYDRVLTVCRQLEAMHHFVSQPATPEQTPLYRTDYIIGSVQPQIKTKNSIAKRAEFINQLPEGLPKTVLNDVFQFESRRQDFIGSLPDFVRCRQHWQAWSHKTNALLSLPVEKYSQQKIQQSVYCQRIDSEWNWAEINEFTLQDADRDFAYNLQIEPSYYETVLYIYVNQGLVREHLLDALNMLILDAVEAPVSIASIITVVSDQVLIYQSEMNKRELADAVMSRIRHFLYHGILEVA